MKQKEKCIVFGCQNHKNEGNFIGDICVPCYKYITTGKVGPTKSFIGVMKVRLDFLENFTRSLKNLINGQIG